MEILYLFPTPRGEIIKKVSLCKAPDTLLYGFNHFKKMGFKVDYLDLPLKKFNFYFPFLVPIEEIFFWLKGINFQLYRILPKLKKINSYDIIVTPFDPLGLPLAFFKKIGLFKRKHIYMSLDFVNRFKNDRDSLLKIFFQWVLSAPEAIICFSQIEREYFKKIFKIDDKKLHFIPAGGDPFFFKPKEKNGEFILSVGKDRSRDFATFFEAVRNLDEKVVVVTGSRTRLPTIPVNVRVLKDISFLELRKLYQKAKMLVLPLYEQERASGQVVLLDGMLSGLPVVVSKVSGITSSYGFEDKKHCFFVQPSDPQKLGEKIQFVLANKTIAKKVAQTGRKAIIENYSTKYFGQKMSEIIKTL